MKSIGELYFDNSFFNDEESKTIGQPLVGSNIETIVKNRRGAKGHLTPQGRAILDHITESISRVLGVRVKAVWDKHCGCSMCPCSPGYRIKADIAFFSRENNRFNMVVSKEGKVEYHIPKSSYELGYTTHEDLQKSFSK